MIDRLFLDYSIRKLRQAAGRVDECLARLTEDQIWSRGSANENSVGNLVLHLCGNIQQWIVSGVGNQPDNRDRDAEFAATDGYSIETLRSNLRQTVDRGVTVIETQTAEALTSKLLIQKYDITVLEAIYHVVEHFGGHAGQIIFATKMLTGDDLGFYQHLKYASHRQKTP